MDSSWVLTNDGNTTAAYTVNLVLNEPIPQGFPSQLLIHKTTTTPAAIECNLAEQVNTILVANIPDPEFVPFSEVANPRFQNPRLQNPTLALAPGESATVTLRIVDLNRYDGEAYDASGAVTPAAVAQSVNTEDIVPGQPPPAPPVAVPMTITTTALPPTAARDAVHPLVADAGERAARVTCSAVERFTAAGHHTCCRNGTLTGTPTTPGNYRFTVRCTDANGNVGRSGSVHPGRSDRARGIRSGVERCGHRLVESDELEPARRAGGRRSRLRRPRRFRSRRS